MQENESQNVHTDIVAKESKRLCKVKSIVIEIIKGP